MIGRVRDKSGIIRILNWVPSLPTRLENVHRAMVREVAPRTLAPIYMTLIAELPPVRDQGQLGSCTAFSAEAPIAVAQSYAKRPNPINPSPLFLYYNERRLNGTIGSDSGAAISDIFRATNLYGICDESLWPYDITKFEDEPPQSVYDTAGGERAHIYAPIPQLKDNLIGCIHHGFPIDFGITVYSSFMSATDGNIPMPASGDTVEGGHAIDLVGYNEASVENDGIPPLSFVFRNSWSEQWGARGYGFLPFDYVLDPQYASDFWMIRTI